MYNTEEKHSSKSFEELFFENDKAFKDYFSSEAGLNKLNNFDDDKDAIKVTFKSSFETEYLAHHLGFLFLDRTVETVIRLNKFNIDLNPYLRLKFKDFNCPHDNEIEFNKVLSIAKETFKFDYRFMTKLCFNEDLLKEYLSNFYKGFVCIYKEQVIGFCLLTIVGGDIKNCNTCFGLKEVNVKDTNSKDINVKETKGQSLFVNLLAADPNYLVTGVGTALYAKAIEYAKDNGFKKLIGRVSTKNDNALNVYTSFGAILKEPYDVYIK